MTSANRSGRGQSILAGIGMLLISAIFIAWAARFMTAEHSLYGWDALGVWQFASWVSFPADHSLISAIATFGRSMHHDYNDLLGLPSICIMALFGPSRFCYVMSSVIFHVVPVAVISCWLFVRFEAATLAAATSTVLAYFALIAVPLPWVVALSGMSDVGGLIMAAIATDLVGRTDVRSKDTKRWLAIGGALAMLAFSKRWFLYLVMGLVLVLMIDVTVTFLRNCRGTGTLTIGGVLTAIRGPFLCGCALIAVYLLSMPLPIVIMRMNLAHGYAAYQEGTSYAGAVGTNIAFIVSRYGLAQVMLAFASFGAAMFFAPVRRAAIFLFVPGWIALLLFSRIQTLNDHHMLLLYLATVVPPLVLARYLLSGGVEHGAPWGWAVLGLAVVISGLGFAAVFASSDIPTNGSPGFSLLSDQRIRPAQRHDIPEIESMLRFIGDKVIVPGQSPVQDVYVLSSSLLLNSSVLSTAGFQLQKDLPATAHISQTRDVDSRDGFPDELLKARLVVVADPLQTHLDTEQKVFTVPARQFLEGRGFAQAFARDPRVFQIDDGVKVYLFERTRPSTPEEIAQLRQEVGLAPSPAAPNLGETAP